MNRRQFLGGTFGCAALQIAARLPLLAANPDHGRLPRRFAPHFGMFPHHAGTDPVDLIRFLADQGFHAMEDCGLAAKSRALQSRIGDELARRGMTMGLFTGLADFARATFAGGDPHIRQQVLRELRTAIEVAGRVGARSLGVVPGKRDVRTPHAIQTKHATDLLRRCADLCEAHDVVMLLEPIDHGARRSRLFLQSADQAARLCRAVDSPSCRLLVDVYQQTSSGQNLQQLLAANRDVLGYVQLADFPGRKEPGSGTIDFDRLLGTLDEIGYRGLLGMEHGQAIPGRAGERHVLDAYAVLDRAGRSCTSMPELRRQSSAGFGTAELVRFR